MNFCGRKSKPSSFTEIVNFRDTTSLLILTIFNNFVNTFVNFKGKTIQKMNSKTVICEL